MKREFLGKGKQGISKAKDDGDWQIPFGGAPRCQLIYLQGVGEVRAVSMVLRSGGGSSGKR